MAKKVVATLQKGEGRKFTRCIKAVKSDKSGAYTFTDDMIHNDELKNYFKS